MNHSFVLSYNDEGTIVVTAGARESGKIVQPYTNPRLHHHRWRKLERWLCFPSSVSSLNYYLSFHYTCIHIKGSSFVLLPGRHLQISVIRRRRMGTEGLLRSKELRQYMLETTVYPREPEILKELRNFTATHPRAAMLTDPDAAQMLALLLEITNAKKTIEIGVFTGYSLLLTALTLPQDGKIIAIDRDQDAFDLGLPFLKKAGVEHKINFINSVAHPVLDELLQHPDELESFDFAYVDADKECYAQYHEKLLKLVKPGGIIVYDNTLWYGTVAQDEESIPERLRKSARWTKEFNKLIAADSRIHICQLPSGDGMTICRRL